MLGGLNKSGASGQGGIGSLARSVGAASAGGILSSGLGDYLNASRCLIATTLNLCAIAMHRAITGSSLRPPYEKI